MLLFTGVKFLRAVHLVLGVEAWAQALLLGFAIGLLHSLHEVVDGDSRFAFSNSFHEVSYS